MSTKEASLSKAKEFAEDWYVQLRGKQSRGEITNERTFTQAADQFLKEYEVITEGERSVRWVEGYRPAPHSVFRLVWALPGHGRRGTGVSRLSA